MDWFNKQFVDECMKFNIEPIGTGDGFLFICPKIPDKATQERLSKFVPEDLPYRFVEGIKSITVQSLKMLCNMSGAEATVTMSNNTVKMDITGQLDEKSDLWNTLGKILLADAYVESYEVKLNGKIQVSFSRAIAKALANRVTMDRDISQDDLLNLKISLESCKSVEDFINNL